MVSLGMMGTWHSRALIGIDARLYTLVERRPEPAPMFAAAFGYDH